MEKSVEKKIGMLVAVELESVIARYGEPAERLARCGFEIYVYHQEGASLYVIHSGIGELSAAAATQLLIDRFEASVIVNFGVVGGLTEEVSRAVNCVVTRVVHYDFDLSGIDPVVPGQYPGLPDVYIPADAQLLEKARKLAPELFPVTCASADRFVGTPEEKAALHEKYGADICEMESAAVLLTCRRCGVPCLMIKAVADGLTGGGKEYYEALRESADRCFEVTDRLIREL